MSSDPDALLKEAAEGNQEAFRALYDILSPRLMAFLLAMVRDRHIAEDILQEAMVSTWNHRADFDAHKASAATWIISIARHRALDHLRKHRRYEDVIHDDAGKIEQTLYDANGDRPDDIQSRRTEHRLSDCMEEIGSDPAACIRLAYFQGFSFREIATLRDNSINTVKSWVRRGLASLRECLQR